MDRPTDPNALRNTSSVFLDDLTDLPNRYFLYNLFSKFTAEAKAKGVQLCISMLDIDNFKHVNDTQGHLRGDRVIKEVAVILRECVRSDDIVIRYAGDEFVILTRIANESEIRHITNRITERVNRNIFKGKAGEPDLNLTLSGGFAISPRDGEDLEELLDNADKALYFSKDRGKNRFSDFKEVSLETKSYKEVLKALSFPGFIDRIPQINKLKEAYNEVLSYWVYFVLVKGKIGIGKSRLVDEFQNHVQLQGAVTLKGVCSSQHTLEPYYAFSKAIDEYLAKAPNASEIISALTDEEKITLQRLIPHIGAPDVKEQDLKKQRLNIFKGLRDILVNLSQAEKGLLLYFDNMQWLDQATLELLNYFLTTETKHKIMFVATFCEEEIKDKELPSKNFIAEPKGKFVSLELGPLSSEETKEFIVASIPNVNASKDFFDSVYKITQGNCLFTQEIIKCLVEDGKILYKDNQWQLSGPEHLDIPSSLEEVIQRRFRKIDPEIKEILAEAAVMGEQTQLEILRQIVKQDQGRLFEIVDQAKEKGVLNPEAKMDEVDFLSDYVRKAIYKEIAPGQKVDFHRKAEETLRDVYKDNLGQAAGDLIYHSQQMGDAAKVAEYKESLLENAQGLFSPEEIESYLEELSREISGDKKKTLSEIEIEKIETEISEEVLTKVLSLVRAISTALKNISLYPPLSKMREQSIKTVYDLIKDMLEGTTSLTLSELNKILLVNSKRIPYRHEKDQVVEYFISLMAERDAKAIQFLPQIEEREVSAFLAAIVVEPDELRKKGGLASLLTQGKITHIKIEEMDYQRLAALQTGGPSKVKERLTSTMLLDFLLSKSKDGKIDSTLLVNQLKSSPENLAKNLVEAASTIVAQKGFKPTDSQHQAQLIAEGIQEMGTKILPGGWRAYIEDLAKLFSHLDKPIQSELISATVNSPQKEMDSMQEVMSSFSANEIVNIICSGYNQSKDSLIYMKDLANKLTIFQPLRKEKVVPVLEDKLKSMGLNETEVSFVTQKEFKDLSLYDRKEMLFSLPARFYTSIGRDNIQDFIGELISTGNKESLQQVITRILEELGQNVNENKEITYYLLGGFISLVTPSSSKFDDILLNVFSVLQKRIEEEEANFYQPLLKDVELAVQWIVSSLATYVSSERWIMHKRLSCLNDFITAFSKKLEFEGEDKGIQKQKDIIKEFMVRFSQSGLIESLAQQLKDTSLYSLIEEIILKFGPAGVEKLIMALASNADFSFESYMYRKKISDILQKIGKPGIQKIKELIAIENDTIKLRFLVEIIGYIRDPDLIEALASLAKHRDPQIRSDVAKALSHFDDAQSNALLSQMCKDSDVSVAQFAKSHQGRISKGI